MGVRTEILRLSGEATGDLWLIRADTPLEADDHPVLTAAVEPPPSCTAVVVDLSMVPVLTVAGAKGLLRCRQELAGVGRAFFLAAADPAVARVIEDNLTGPADSVVVVPSVDDVIGLCTPQGAEAAASEAVARLLALPGPRDDEALRREVRALRGKLRTYPLIAQAQGVLQERYGLTDAREAFALLQRSSQRHNVKLRALAAAVVQAPRPRNDTGTWFVGRVRRQAPPLGFVNDGTRADQLNRSAVLSAVLHRTLEISGTSMGNVQLVDPLTGGLWMEKHRGLSEEFVDFFALVGSEGTSCALAAHHVSRVTVTEVGTDPSFSEAARETVLAAGSRSCHSTPLTDGDGRCVGMTSAHLDRPGRTLTSAQARALDELGAQAGEWLTWHQRTVVLDALEHLHQRARESH